MRTENLWSVMSFDKYLKYTHTHIHRIYIIYNNTIVYTMVTCDI